MTPTPGDRDEVIHREWPDLTTVEAPLAEPLTLAAPLPIGDFEPASFTQQFTPAPLGCSR